MASRRRGRQTLNRSRRTMSWPEEFRDYTSPVKTIAVKVPLPLSVAYSVPKRDHTWKPPVQRQMLRRSIRRSLSRRPERYVLRSVRIRVPERLPAVRGSYVSIDRRGRLVVHSRRQTAALLEREHNRRRYQEHKTRRRRARDGQLDSVPSDRLGIVAEAVHRGYGIRRIADAAMVARAVGGF